jgi:vancomycin resistance protein YoaR
LANVKAAAARFNGVVIEPQATFSFNAIVGNISKEEGFEEGLVIVGNRTVKGVGGGVCQVSTTAFQAALRYGFPIVERYPHGYRVRYYEDKNFGLGPGYDATVFAPWADLKFVNDSDTHVLIETQYDPAKVTLTFNLYGTSDGRKANLTPGIVENEVPAPTDIYEKDTEGDVKPGEIKQTDFAVAGATISFNYTVSRDGEVISTQKFVSKYTPWANRFKFGEGAKLPEGAQVVAADPQ